MAGKSLLNANDATIEALRTRLAMTGLIADVFTAAFPTEDISTEKFYSFAGVNGATVGGLTFYSGDYAFYDGSSWSRMPSASSAALTSLGVIDNAVGDGVTDDTTALQAAIDSVTSEGVVQLGANKTYLISSPLVFDTKKVKKITSNNCKIIVSGDIVALSITGTMTGTSTASPSSLTDQIKEDESFTVIENIRITSSVFGEGTAIKLDGVFGIKIDKCSFFGMKNGIEVRNQNRNFIFSNNHIYNNKGTGIDFDSSVNLHQINILGNHISYSQKGISIINSKIYNLQINGNDIEADSVTGVTDSTIYCIYAKVETPATLNEVSISANTMQAHSDQHILHFESDTKASDNVGITAVEFVGNTFGNALTNDIYLKNVRGVVLSGNTSLNSVRHTVKLDGSCVAVSIAANSSIGNGGLVECTATAVLEEIVITSNPIHNATGEVISLNPASATKGLIIKDNPIHTKSTYVTGNVIDIDTTNIDGLILKENIVRCDENLTPINVVAGGANIVNSDNIEITY